MAGSKFTDPEETRGLRRRPPLGAQARANVPLGITSGWSCKLTPSKGFCCKNWRGMGEGLVEVWDQCMLGGQPKQAVNELDLTLDSSSSNLSLPNHVHRLVAL